jgi:hypothetical protein
VAHGDGFEILEWDAARLAGGRRRFPTALGGNGKIAMKPSVLPALAIAAAATLTGFAIARLPPRPWRAPGTPFDLSIPAAARDFAFLSEAARVLPAGASVVAHAEPVDPAADDALARMAIALLPGRDVIPAAVWRVPNPDADARAEFIVIEGGFPAESRGELLFRNGSGTVWHRKRAVR